MRFRVTSFVLLQLIILSTVLSNSTEDVAQLIVGGRLAAPGQFPYLVSLRTSAGHFCGGSILNSRWILSAARCHIVFNIVEIAVGSVKIEEGEVYGLDRVIYHPSYNRERNPTAYDLCLLKSNRTIEFHQLVQPISLNRNQIRRRTSATIAGWGSTERGNLLNPEVFPFPANQLKFIDVNIISNAECSTRLFPLSFILRNDHICTFARGAGVCIFDAGGPIVADGEVIGVVSAGIPCALNYPDWGSRISSFARWIDSIIIDFS